MDVLLTNVAYDIAIGEGLTVTELIRTELFVYLDDIGVYANTLEEHEIKLKNLAERLRKANLYLQTNKCEFLRPELGYLGNIIDKNEVRPHARKVIAVIGLSICNGKNVITRESR